jgi:hypothetical protein
MLWAYNKRGYMKKENFNALVKQISDLVITKNEAYGSSFSESRKILEVLYPNGVGPDQYTDLLLITRMIDKLFRIANKKDAFGESPFMDLAGYSVLGAVKDLENAMNQEKE